MNIYKIVATISIVSHNQAEMVSSLCSDLENFGKNLKLIITVNDGPRPYVSIEKFANVLFIVNNRHLGYGHNHNNAFTHCDTPFFIISNPDIRIDSQQLELILFNYIELANTCVWGPLLIESGHYAENGRAFPTFTNMLLRFFRADKTPKFRINTGLFKVDWIGGMFMVFSYTSYSKVGGFDQNKFYMYLEDTDICKRLRSIKIPSIINTHVCINHEAQRKSKKNLKYFYWHLRSLVNFLFF